eukprot:Tbor_TRINITY_DN4042_c0_g1::TRINITY_DN4042_c0_g1_i1::g.11705::m.11705
MNAECNVEENSANLKKQLDELNERFNSWKDSAKRGVEKLQKQVIVLSEENDVLLSKNNELVEINSRCRQELESALASQQGLQWKGTPQCSQNDTNFFKSVESMQDFFSSTISEFSAASIKKSDFIITLMSNIIESSDKKVQESAELLVISNANLEKYRRKVDMTLKLASKDQNGIKEEYEKQKVLLEENEKELSDVRNAVKQRDIAINVLEGKLEESIETLQEYQKNYNQFIAREKHAEALENDMKAMESEFLLREESLQSSQQAEIYLIKERYEDEIKSLKLDHEQRLIKAIMESRNSNGSHSVSNQIVSDGAYNDLLEESEKLKKTLEEKKISESKLLKELHTCQQKLSRLEVPVKMRLDPKDESSHTDTSDVDPQILRRMVYNLEKKTSELSEQLWKANHKLLDYREKEESLSSPDRNKYNSISGPSYKVGSCSDSENVDKSRELYLRAILVKMLCAKTDDVKSSLLPVIASIVSLSDNDLVSIYSAHPSWACVH